jgi:hypothetical protein
VPLLTRRRSGGYSEGHTDSRGLTTPPQASSKRHAESSRHLPKASTSSQCSSHFTQIVRSSPMHIAHENPSTSETLGIAFLYPPRVHHGLALPIGTPKPNDLDGGSSSDIVSKIIVLRVRRGRQEGSHRLSESCFQYSWPTESTLLHQGSRWYENIRNVTQTATNEHSPFGTHARDEARAPTVPAAQTQYPAFAPPPPLL